MEPGDPRSDGASTPPPGGTADGPQADRRRPRRGLAVFAVVALGFWIGLQKHGGTSATPGRSRSAAPARQSRPDRRQPRARERALAVASGYPTPRSGPCWSGRSPFSRSSWRCPLSVGSSSSRRSTSTTWPSPPGSPWPWSWRWSRPAGSARHGQEARMRSSGRRSAYPRAGRGGSRSPRAGTPPLDDSRRPAHPGRRTPATSADARRREIVEALTVATLTLDRARMAEITAGLEHNRARRLAGSGCRRAGADPARASRLGPRRRTLTDVARRGADDTLPVPSGADGDRVRCHATPSRRGRQATAPRYVRRSARRRPGRGRKTAR